MAPTQFHRSGFTMLRGLVADPDLDALRVDADAKLHEPLPAGCVRPHNTLAPLSWNDPPVGSLLGRGELVARIVAATGARDLRWISGYISVKDAPSAPLGWHQDWWCWSHPVSFGERAPQIAVLCYLGDTDAQSGALRVLPGTHRQSVELHRALADAPDDPTGTAENDAALSDHADQLTLAAQAGDAVVIDYRLLHGTHANHSAWRRDCLILNFAPNWSDLPDDVRAHLIRHPALPQSGEAFPEALGGLLPDYAGRPRDLELARTAPVDFVIGSAA